MSIRLGLALVTSITIVAGSPLVGVVRQELLVRWPSGYVPVLAATVGLSAVALLVLALRGAVHRTAEQPPRWSRPKLAMIALAFGLALVVGYLDRTGDMNVDVVEAFHFVEFSALTCLLAWASVPLAPGHAWVWGSAGSIVVGAFDEWTQWFVPGRTGEIRDVGTDAVAAVCGLLLVVALEIGGPPDMRRARRPLAIASTAALLAVAVCFSVIHLGTVVEDGEAGRFPTRFTGPQLVELGADRQRQWGRAPIPEQAMFAQEDQYLSEALWHVRRRNRAMEATDAVGAWREERILEKYFAPVLQVEAAGRPAGHALSPQQLAAIEPGRTGAAGGVSDASPIPILAWSRGLFWTVVAGVVSGAAVVAASATKDLR